MIQIYINENTIYLQFYHQLIFTIIIIYNILGQISNYINNTTRN